MKNTSYKNKQFVLLGMTFLSVAGIAGCSKVELAQSTVTLELGDELSENVADYLQDPDEKILKGASLDLSAVDETKVGSYNAAVAYDGKNYPFTVEVKDTTSPQCKAKDYIYMQPGTLTMDDLVTEIKDASETSSGIVSCEQKEDLVVCDYDDMLQEKAVVDTTDSYDEADYQESVQLDEEGCYEVTAQVKDSEGNFTDITLNVYADGTAPELAQNVIDLDVDASGISIDDINTDDAEKIADMLHELPDFSNAEWAAASDAFCGDNAISYEFEQKSFNLQKENPVEVLNVHCTVQDQAKNENEADYEVTVTYTGLDVEALLEKTGLIMQISDVTANDKKSGKSDNKSGTTNTQNQLSQASGKSNADKVISFLIPYPGYIRPNNEPVFITFSQAFYGAIRAASEAGWRVETVPFSRTNNNSDIDWKALEHIGEDSRVMIFNHWYYPAFDALLKRKARVGIIRYFSHVKSPWDHCFENWIDAVVDTKKVASDAVHFLYTLGCRKILNANWYYNDAYIVSAINLACI